VTANLTDANGTTYGAQWTLFRQATKPGAQQEGWANQQLWMGHAAVTRADTHRTSETLHAAVSVKPVLRQTRFLPGSMPGKCAGLAPLTQRTWRRSNSRL